MPTPKHVLSREAYERLAFQIGLPEDGPLAVLPAEVEYPKTTTQAATELRHRGLRASYNIMLWHLKQGTVSPLKFGKSCMWSPADIDKVAERMTATDSLTGRAQMFKELSIDAAQYLAALREQAVANVAKLGQLADDPHFYNMLVVGGKAAVDPATVTLELRRDWKDILPK